jgi:predicted dinucleotide-binding enzyme
MTNERASAYGRVVATLDEVGATKLQPGEVERIRHAADTLLFCESADDPAGRQALEDVEELAMHLIDTGRWLDTRARALADDVAACGPLAPVS